MWKICLIWLYEQNCSFPTMFFLYFQPSCTVYLVWLFRGAVEWMMNLTHLQQPQPQDCSINPQVWPWCIWNSVGQVEVKHYANGNNMSHLLWQFYHLVWCYLSQLSSDAWYEFLTAMGTEPSSLWLKQKPLPWASPSLLIISGMYRTNTQACDGSWFGHLYTFPVWQFSQHRPLNMFWNPVIMLAICYEARCRISSLNFLCAALPGWFPPSLGLATDIDLK